MKLLVTGATGFIGSHLAFEARAQGHSVVATGAINNEVERERAGELTAAQIPLICGLLQDPAFVSRIVTGCEAVIHLAAAQHEANVPDEDFEEVNIEATRRLLDACVDAGMKRFVYGSTTGVYGDSTAHALSEQSPVGPQNIHAITKLAAERIVASRAAQIGVTIVRISETYGPGDRRLLELFKAAERGLLPLIGPGANLRQPIHVHDMVRGLVKAAQHPAAVNQTLILAGPTPMSARETIDSIAGAVQRRPLIVRMPLRPVYAAATLAEKSCKRLGIQPPLLRRSLDFFTQSFCFDTDKAKRLIGFEATIPFSMGAQDTASWYRNAGLLRSSHGTAIPSAHMNRTGAPDIPLTSFAADRLDLSKILEYTHDAIIVWEMDGAGIIYWNRAAEQLYGYSRQQAHGRITHLLLHTQLEGGVDHLQDKVCRYGIWLGNLRHRKRDGSSVVVHARLALMAQRNGRWLVLEINRELSALSSHAPQHGQQRACETGKIGVRRRSS